jgi:hypothetical protein
LWAVSLKTQNPINELKIDKDTTISEHIKVFLL